MATEPTERAAAVFFALSHVPPSDRARLLDERCGGDAALRREVERLLEGLDFDDASLDGLAPDGSSRDTTGLPPSLSVRDDEMTQPAGAIIGGFVVVRQIGSGATGVVYLAHQQYPARIVALKVLRRELMATTVRRRFELEAELLGQLQHPGIAQIYAAHPGDATIPPFIAMELVNGPPLTEYADSRQLSPHERVELVARACDAVQHAHQRGIIHRDLKPGNILVNEDGEPKVLDFGVARTAGADVALTTIETEIGQLLGTVAYMSPEQVEATPGAIDTRTDIYALGVILFRLLAGRLPFGHDDPPLPELARRIARDDAPKLGTIDGSLRGDLETIVARALAKEKDRRYASAASLASDLRRYLAGQPISASADSAWYVVRRRIARYRLALAFTAVTVVALAGLAAYAIFQRARADLTNVRLQDELATSTIERGRAMSFAGNMPAAEELVWRELFRQPDSRLAQWALWDIYSREPSRWTRAFHETGTLMVRFSPDNRYVLTVGQSDGLLLLVDADSGEVVRTLTGTPGVGTRRAFFSPDGSMVIGGGKDGTLRAWDVQTGTLRHELPRVVPALEDFAIAGAGSHGVTVAAGSVQVWALATGQKIADFSTIVPDAAFVAADPAGTLIIAGGRDGTLTALDTNRRTPLWKTHAHDKGVISVAVGPHARIVASGGFEGLIQIWNASTGERLRTLSTENGSVRNLAFGADGTRIVSAGQWRTQLWNLEDPSQPVRVFGGAEGMTDLDIRPDLRAVVTCHGASGLVRLWDVTADARGAHWAGHRAAVTGIAIGLGAEGRSIASAGADGVVAIWKPGQPTPLLTMKPDGRASGLAISDDKRWLVSVGQPGTAAVWDAHDGRRVASFTDAGASRAVLFGDAGRKLVIGDIDGWIDIRDWTDGVATNPRRVRSHDSEVLAMASRGTRLFLAHRETMVLVRDIATGREIRRLKPTASPFSIAASPDGRLLAAGTWPGVIDLWDVETGQKLQSLKGPTALITSLEFTADGRVLAVASRDGSTRLLDVTAGQWLATVAARKPGAERLRLFPDGRHVAIGYEDGEVEIRDMHYFFRYAAGHAAYQLQMLRAGGESPPRSEEVLAWSRKTR